VCIGGEEEERKKEEEKEKKENKCFSGVSLLTKALITLIS
jgi:hypothetical protein